MPPTCTTELGLVMKKREPLRTSLHLFSHQSQSFLLNLTLLEIRLVIFEYLAILQYAPVMSKWQFVCDGGACVAQRGLIAKRGELSRFVLYLLFQHSSLPPFPLLSSTFLKMRPAIFEYLAIFKYAPMSKWQFIDFSYTALIVEFSPDDIALLNKRLQRQTTNQSRQLHYVKLNQNIL